MSCRHAVAISFAAIGVLGASIAFAQQSVRLGQVHLASVAATQDGASQVTAPTALHAATRCSGDNGGISLPPGFCATVFADDLGHARHLAIAANGVVYVNTWSGGYYGFNRSRLPNGGFLVALRDTDGDGGAEVVQRFGDGVGQGSAGGTGIALYKDGLYAEVNDRIVRYMLRAGEAAPSTPPEVILSGMPLTGDHPMHPFEIDARGNLFVSMGSASNGEWLWGDGSLASIKRTIEQGVAIPKQADGAMPPKGGVSLSSEQLDAVAAYVWAVGHRRTRS